MNNRLGWVFLLGIVMCIGKGVLCDEGIDEEFLIPDSVTKVGFVVGKGKMFSVRLKGNPTTGYAWVLINGKNVIDGGFIKPMNMSKDYQAVNYNKEKGVIGGKGFEGSYQFIFQATSDIDNNNTDDLHQLIFAYRRPWEDGKAARVVTIMIKISNNK